ncbi:uncharacterized protein WM294_015633 [Sarcoramphus papa]
MGLRGATVVGAAGAGLPLLFLLLLLLPVPVPASDGPRGGLRLCRRLLWETRELAERYVAERLAGARLHLSPPPGHPLAVSIPARDWMALTARQRLGALGRRLAALRGRWGALGAAPAPATGGRCCAGTCATWGGPSPPSWASPRSPPRPPAPHIPPHGEWGRRREAFALLRATEVFLLRALRDFLLLCRPPAPRPAP